MTVNRADECTQVVHPGQRNERAIAVIQYNVHNSTDCLPGPVGLGDV
jgi:hypothetical protein